MTTTSTPADLGDPLWMPHPRELFGIDLRYLLTVLLFAHGPSTVFQLAERIEELGLEVRGRPSKAISDALRWEMGRGRVVRLRRGVYAPGKMPASTERRLRARTRHLIALGKHSVT